METKESIFKMKGFRFIIIAAVAGVILIFIGTFSDSLFSQDSPQPSAETDIRSADELESKLESLIEKIDGITSVSVMITYECGSEHVYARDTDSSGKVFNYVVINKSAGTEMPILVKEVEPKIKGIAVVCNSGSNPSIQAKIIGLLSALFNITSNRICVTD